METPSHGLASSPDPLNERDEDPTLPAMSSAARRVTRSQRSNSMYSLDAHSHMQASRFSSPRKQTFHLDVGSGKSPQKIRVTVETEDNGSASNSAQEGKSYEESKAIDGPVKRRLFQASTPTPSLIAPLKPLTASRRRQRSSSPAKSSAAPSSKKAKIDTMTTKVPLRGLSDDELEDMPRTTIVATPKPRRGRPRRSGTPMPVGSTTLPSSPPAATPARATSATPKRTRKTRSVTPKVEDTSATDELASIDATSTPGFSSAKRARTPRATRATRTPAKNTPASAAASKRSASSAFLDSDADSVTDSQPRKRRGRPRRQAMAPDEMAAIAEEDREEEQQTEQTAETTERVLETLEQDTTPGVVSESPDPIVDGPDDATPTARAFAGARTSVSPAPTTLSSVDLINVQTPARPNGESDATEDFGDDFAYEAGATDGYFSDHSPSAPYDRETTPAVNATMAPATAATGNDGLQTPELPHPIDNARPKTQGPREAASPIGTTDMAANEQDESDDELAHGTTTPDPNAHSDIIGSYNDAPIFSEDVQATTPFVNPVEASQPFTSASAPSSPILEKATTSHDSTGTTGALVEEDVVSPAVGHEQHEAMTTSPLIDLSPDNHTLLHSQGAQPTPGDQIHPPSAELPLVHEHSIVQSELTAADSDDEVDAVHFGDESDNEAGSDAGEYGDAKHRDQDTIAQGEDFSMIGMESLQSSFQLSRGPLPEMGEMTSRIVSRSLQSIRHGNSVADNQDNDGLSYLDFLNESSPSAPSSAPVVDRDVTPAVPATHAASSASAKDHEADQRSPVAKNSSPRRKEEPLGKLIARKSLYEAHTSGTTPPPAAVQEPRSDQQHQHSQQYDDSFSAIPDSVLDAAVPEANDAAFFSQQQAELTGRIAIPGPALVEYTTGHSSPEHGQSAASQAGSEVTSSPPIHQAQAQRSYLAQENRITPAAFLSPRFPHGARIGETADQTGHLRVPSEDFRPSLSPIVRAGRALQSITSDPPTPKDNEAFLRSPFRGSVARDTQSPAAPSRQDSSSPDHEPANYELVEAQLVREQTAESERAAASMSAHDEAVQDSPVQTTSPQHLPAVTQSPVAPSSSASRRAWDMALIPVAGAKSLFANGRRILTPSLRRPASSSAPPTSPAQVTPSPAPRPSPPKRTAGEAQLDQAPGSGPSSPRAKRARPNPQAITPSRANEMQPGSGSETGRSWRSYVFRENSVAGSITGFAAKLISRTPRNSSPREPETEALAAPAEDVAMQEARAKVPVLRSEANSTEYGSDAIMDMINDISGEGQDVRAITTEDADQTNAEDVQEAEDMDVNDVPEMTSALLLSPILEPEYASPQSPDEDDFDMWAVEAERTTRLPAPQSRREPSTAEPAGDPAPTSAPASLRDPRIARVQESSGRRRSNRLGGLGGSAVSQSRPGALYDPEFYFESPQDNESDANNPPRPSRSSGNAILDDFFSSPVALPRELPPTSEQNVRFNEQSRLRAVAQHVEHERRKTSQKLLADAPQPTQAAPSGPSRPSAFVLEDSDSELSETSVVESPALPRIPAPVVPHAPIGETMRDRGEEDSSRHIVEEDALEELPVNSSVARPRKGRISQAALIRSRALNALRKSASPTPALNSSESAAGQIPTPSQPAPSQAPPMPNALMSKENRPHAKMLPSSSPLSRSLARSTAKSLFRQSTAVQPSLARRSSTQPSPAARSTSSHRSSPQSSVAQSPEVRLSPAEQRNRERSAALLDQLEKKGAFENVFFDAELRGSTVPEQRPFETATDNQSQFNVADYLFATQLEAAANAPGANLYVDLKRDDAEDERARLEEMEASLVRNGEQGFSSDRLVVDELAAVLSSSPANDRDSEIQARHEARSVSANAQGDADHENYEDNVDEDDNEDEDDEYYRSLGINAGGSAEDDQSNGADESSFLTPNLKPLPAKSASPTKSCIRPQTKPKTPGRVVVFAEYDNSQLVRGERARISNAALQFARHFGLDTENRVPVAGAANSPSPQQQQEPVNEDGDVRMLDRKEVQQQEAILAAERRARLPYEVVPEVSDMMMADTHEISHVVPWWNRQVKTAAGQATFHHTTSVVGNHFQPPHAIELPPAREWDLSDWVSLNHMLQTLRGSDDQQDGAPSFAETYLPQWEDGAYRKGPRRNGSVKRPSYVLLNKVVHTEATAMLVKCWHLDVVDAFMLRSGMIWNAHFVLRRLFSLLLSETRRGVYDPDNRRRLPSMRE